MQRKLLLFIFIFTSLLICAQHQEYNSDSLKQLLRTAKPDTSRISLLYHLSESYQFLNIDTCSEYAHQGLKLAEVLNNEKAIADGTFLSGYVDYIKGDFDDAKNHFSKALDIYKELKDLEGIAKSTYHLGIIYVFTGNYVKANECFFDALKRYDALGVKGAAANCIVAIGNVYGRQGNDEKELEYHTKALEAKIAMKDEYGMSACYINVGNCYGKIQKWDIALDYYFKGLALAEKLKNPKWIINAAGNIGGVYTETGRPQEALKYLERVKKLCEETGDKQALIETLSTIGQTYSSLGKYPEARENVEHSISMAKEIGSIVDEKTGYENLSEIYAKTGNFKEAYHYHQLYSNLKDTIFQEENTKQFAEMGAKYEADKKDTEIKLLNKDNEIQSANIRQQLIIIWAGAGGLILVLLLTFFIFRQFREKQKANVKLEQAYHQIEEKNKDITDSINYAKRIQSAILPSSESLRKVFTEMFVLYRPKDIVSGDFYWFTEKNGYAFLAVGDCTGHGVPGAFMSMIGNDMLTHIIIEKGILEPNTILTMLHDGVKNALKQDNERNDTRDGMDIALVRYKRTDSATELVYAGALRPLWIIRKNEKSILELKADKHSIGGSYSSEQRLFHSQQVLLQQGDALYMSTDGYADQFGGEHGKKFMTKNMKELLISVSAKSMDEQNATLVASLESWKKHTQQVDDILVVGVRI